jgi:putative ABC transport system permease protein
VAVEPGLTMVANDRVIGIFRAVSWSSAAIAIAIGVLVILNTMLMAVTERTAEIGILHAVGWPRKRIVALFVVEGALLSAIAAPVGLLAGYLAAQTVTALPQVAGFLEPRIDARMLVEAALAAVLLGVLGSFYPALRASRIDPAVAMWR